MVDEDPAVHRLLSALFTPEGHAVEAVRTGEQGLRLVREQEYDLIIADVRAATGPAELFAERCSRPSPKSARLVVVCSGEEDLPGPLAQQPVHRVQETVQSARPENGRQRDISVAGRSCRLPGHDADAALDLGCRGERIGSSPVVPARGQVWGVDEPAGGPEENIAGDLGAVAGPVQHQPIAHAVEQVSPQLRPGGPLEDDSLLQSGQHVVVDAIAPARVAGLAGRIHPDADLATDQHVGQNGVVAAVVAHDTGAREPMTVLPRRVLPPE